MCAKRVPDILSVIVVSAKGLKPKKEDKAQFSVIFGIGTTKANTESTESKDGCPIFNCEHEFKVPSTGSVLTLKVVEAQNDEILGRVSIPISDVLSLTREYIKTYPLQPHKKRRNVIGDLNLIVWVSRWKAANEEDNTSDEGGKVQSFNFTKIKGFLMHDGVKSESSLAMKKKAFSSNDLSSMQASSLVPLEDDSFLQSFRSKDTSGKHPEVSGISPVEGPSSGGTRLVITGYNLGERREDVIGLFVCGSNILGSLEYVSPNKLICTTKPWKPCVGNICLETQSGGKGTSLIQFMFLPSNDDAGLRKNDGADDSGISMDGGSLRRMQEAKQSNEGSPRNSLARSLFNLAKRSDSFEKQKMEILSVSPKEAVYNMRTKLTIKGNNMAVSRLDVLRILVCNIDCTDTLEFDSPSKLICYIGPTSTPVTGVITIETTSGGTCSSHLEFKLLPDKREAERSNGREGGKLGFFGNIKRQHFSSSSSAGDSALSTSPTLEPGSRLSLPPSVKPPVLEVFPMTKSKKKEDRVTVLERKLMDKGKEIEELMDKNKKLHEECERLRDYMNLIVSRALVACPQILSNEVPAGPTKMAS